MNTIYQNKTFTRACIEEEHEGDTFKKCTFNECYIEVKTAEFIECRYINSHVN